MKHILRSEIRNSEGAWRPDALELSMEFEKNISDLLKKYAGKMSLDSLEYILLNTVHFAFMTRRLNSISFEDNQIEPHVTISYPHIN